jgi:hypothetical protein
MKYLGDRTSVALLEAAPGVLEPGVNLIEKPFSKSGLLTKLHEVPAEPR